MNLLELLDRDLRLDAERALAFMGGADRHRQRVADLKLLLADLR